MASVGKLTCGALFVAFGIPSAAISPLRVDGVVTAVFTPYESNGSLALGLVPSIAKYQKSMGVKGVFVGGTTGDSLALSLSERKALAESWAPAAKANGLIFIVHVGAESLADVTELARHAAHLGADAIGCMSSVFFKPANVHALALWLQQVGLAAPTLPLYYYHIPSMTGVNFKMLDLLKEVEQVHIPSFVGVKYTGLYEDDAFPDFQRCLSYAAGRYEILCGREEMTLEALAVGARGFIGSQFNFVADLYRAIEKAWPDTTRARKLQNLGLRLIDVWKQVPEGVNGNRLVMDSTPVPVGPARLPSLQPDDPSAQAFAKQIHAWCQEATSLNGSPFEMCKATHVPKSLSTVVV